MYFDMGDIIIVKGTIFKDTGLYDTRIYGHPVVVLHANDKFFYYLTMSSRKNLESDARQYYDILSTKNKSRQNSYINCKDIYKRDIEMHSIRSRIDEYHLLNLLLKFIHYQENVLEDEFYNEVKGNVKRYVR